MKAVLCAVVPNDQVQSFTGNGTWLAGRCNNYTTTLYREFPSEDEATKAGRKLPFVWGVERLRRDTQ
jgi:hypothetical protein